MAVGAVCVEVSKTTEFVCCGAGDIVADVDLVLKRFDRVEK